MRTRLPPVARAEGGGGGASGPATDSGGGVYLSASIAGWGGAGGLVGAHLARLVGCTT
jgi:hypothetical protein